MNVQENSSLVSASEENRNAKILSPLVRDSLINIINQLRPFEYFTLSSACKGLREVCLRSPGISVNFKMNIIVGKRGRKIAHSFEAVESLKEQNINWNRVQKWLSFPFVFTVDTIYFFSGRNVSKALIDKSKRFLEKMALKKVSSLRVFTRRAEWKELILFAKNYQMECISPTNSTIIGNEELKEIMGMKLEDFGYFSIAVDDEDLGNVNIRRLSVKAPFMKETAQKLIERWLSRDLVIGEWIIQYSLFTRSDLQSIFRRFPTIYSDSYTGPLLDVRPLVVVKEEGGDDYFFLIRDDNLVINVFITRGFASVELTTEYNFSHEPEILVPILY